MKKGLMVLILCSLSVLSIAQSYKEIFDNIVVYSGKQDSENLMAWIDKGFKKSKEDYGKTTDKYYALVCEKIAIIFNLKAQTEPQYAELRAYYLEDALRVHKLYFPERQNNYVMTGYDLGILYRKMSKYQDAISVLEEVHPVMLKLKGKEDDNYINLQYELAMSYCKAGLYGKAKTNIEEVYAYTQKNHAKTIEMVNVLEVRAEYFATLGNYEKAEADYRQAAQLLVNEPTLANYKNTRLPGTIGDLGKLYVDMGKYVEAENFMTYELQNNPLPQSPTPSQRNDYASTLNSLGTLYLQMGRYEEAAKLIGTALAQVELAYGKNHLNYAINLSDLAQLKLLLQRFEDTDTDYKTATEIVKNLLGENHLYYALLVNNHGEAYRRMGKVLEATEKYTQAKTICEKNQMNQTAFYGVVLNNLAATSIETKNYPQAEQYLTQALQIVEKTVGVNHPNYQLILANLSVVYSINGKSALAKEYARKCAKSYLYQIENTFPSLTEKEKTQFYESASQVFNSFNITAVAQAKEHPDLLEDMYNHLLVTKGLIVNDTKKQRQQILKSGNPELIAVYQQWLNAREQLAKAYLLPVEEQKKIGLNSDSLNVLAQSLSKDVARLGGKSLKTTLSENSWKKIQQKLSPGEAAIEMTEVIGSTEKLRTDSTQYVALIITPTSKYPEMVVFNNTYTMNFTGYANYQRAIKNKAKDEDSYNLYWKAIADKLKGI